MQPRTVQEIEIRPDLQGTFECFQRRFVALLLKEYGASIVKSFDIPWIEGNRPIVACQCGLVALQILQRNSPAEMGFCEFWIERDCPFEACKSSFVGSKISQRGALVLVRLRIAGIEEEGPFVAFQCGFMVLDVGQCCAEIVMRLSLLRVDRQRAGQEFHPIMRPPGIYCDHAQEMQCVKVVRLRAKNQPAEPFRLDQVALLEQVQGSLRSLLQGQRRSLADLRLAVRPEFPLLLQLGRERRTRLSRRSERA